MKKLNFFQKIAIIHKIEKSAQRVKELAKNNKQLSIDMQKALLNLNADIEILIGLLPPCRSVLNNLKDLINDILVN